MVLMAVRCPYCQSDQVIKGGLLCKITQDDAESFCYRSIRTVGRGYRKFTGASCPSKRLVSGARDLMALI